MAIAVAIQAFGLTSARPAAAARADLVGNVTYTDHRDFGGGSFTDRTVAMNIVLTDVEPYGYYDPPDAAGAVPHRSTVSVSGSARSFGSPYEKLGCQVRHRNDWSWSGGTFQNDFEEPSLVRYVFNSQQNKWALGFVVRFDEVFTQTEELVGPCEAPPPLDTTTDTRHGQMGTRVITYYCLATSVDTTEDEQTVTFVDATVVTEYSAWPGECNGTLTTSLVPPGDVEADFTIVKQRTGVYDFSATSVDGGGQPLTHDWTFGDGGTARGASVTHTYTKPGNRTVTLTSTDPDDNEDTEAKQLHIAGPALEVIIERVGNHDDLAVGDKFEVAANVRATDGVGKIKGIKFGKPPWTTDPASAASLVAGLGKDALTPFSLAAGRSRRFTAKMKVRTTPPFFLTTTVSGKDEADVAVDATDEIKIGSQVVQGSVSDVVVQYPNGSIIDTDNPIAGATVRLLDDEDTEIDSVQSASTGSYSLEIPEPGTYTVEALASADRFRSSMTQIEVNGETVRDDREIDVAEDQTGTVEQDLFLPVSLVSKVSRQIYDLRHLDTSFDFFFPVPGYDGTVDLAFITEAFNFLPWVVDLTDAFRYDTASTEALLDKAIDLDFEDLTGTGPARFDGVYAGAGDKDGWNSLIRGSLFLSGLHSRFKDASSMADLFAKTAASAIAIANARYGTSELPKPLARASGLLGGGKPPRIDTQQYRDLKARKIGVMAFFVGVLLPRALDAAGVPGPQKGVIIERTAKFMRYAIDILILYETGRWKDLANDAGFEVLFGMMRIGAMWAYLSTHVQFSQDDLDSTMQELVLAHFGGHTRDAVSAVHNLTARSRDETVAHKTEAGNVLQINSLVRGIEGVLGVHAIAFDKAGAQIKPGDKKGYSWFADKATAYLKDDRYGPEDAEVKSGKKNPGQLKGIGPATAISMVAYGSVFLVTWADYLARQVGMIPLQTAARLAVEPGGTTAKVASRERRSTPVATASAAATTELEAWLSAVRELRSAVTATSPDRVADAWPGFLAADEALSDRLDPVAERAITAHPLAIDNAGLGLLSTFSGSVEVRDRATALAASFLEVWTASPKASTAEPFLKVIADAVNQSELAVDLLDRTEALLGTMALPARLAVSRGAGPPEETLLSSGGFDLDVVVTNHGDATSGVAELSLEGVRGIDVMTAMPLAITALAPGASQVFTVHCTATDATAASYSGSMLATVVSGGAVIEGAEFGFSAIAPPGA